VPRKQLAAALCALALSACGTGSSSPAGPATLSLWTHGGTPGEQAALTSIVAEYEAAHPGTKVQVRVVPEGDYNDVLQAANASGTLPDVLDVDGPLVASFAYHGALEPLDALLPKATRERMLPSLVAQGTWRGRLWAVGAFDSGLGLYGDKRALTAAGIRIPQGPEDAWTGAEMSDALLRLARRDPDHKVLDLKLDYGTGEWLTYGFAPLVSSAGGALVDPTTGRAGGTLDGPAAVRALSALRSWTPYVDDDKDGKAFVRRRAALSWVGHWTYADYSAALGHDLVVLPLPDLGVGSKSGQGSWAWAVGKGTPRPKQAGALLDWLTADRAASAITKVNGAVPGTRAALALSPLVSPNAPLHLYADQLARTCGAGPVTTACTTVPRPVTPAYPVVTAAFSAAVAAVLHGGDPQQALTAAAKTIDEDLRVNRGYLAGP